MPAEPADDEERYRQMMMGQAADRSSRAAANRQAMQSAVQGPPSLNAGAVGRMGGGVQNAVAQNPYGPPPAQRDSRVAQPTQTMAPGAADRFGGNAPAEGKAPLQYASRDLAGQRAARDAQQQPFDYAGMRAQYYQRPRAPSAMSQPIAAAQPALSQFGEQLGSRLSSLFSLGLGGGGPTLQQQQNKVRGALAPPPQQPPIRNALKGVFGRYT